jgi:transcriptional regulator with XRE-family HTH domain
MKLIEIKKWLLDKGIRQKDLAAQMNRTPGTVSAVLNGLRKSRPLAKLLKDLGCPETFLKMKKKAA